MRAAGARAVGAHKVATSRAFMTWWHTGSVDYGAPDGQVAMWAFAGPHAIPPLLLALVARYYCVPFARI